MLSMLAYAHHLLDMVFLGVVPWWFYEVLSIAAAFIIFVELPTRVGLVLGVAAALIFGDLGFTAKGYQMGVAAEHQKVVDQVAAERARMEQGFKQALADAQARADAAEATNETLRQERHDAIDSAPETPGSPSVIPPGSASKLFNIGKGKPAKPRVPASPPRSPGRARSLPRVLLPGHFATFP